MGWTGYSRLILVPELVIEALEVTVVAVAIVEFFPHADVMAPALGAIAILTPEAAACPPC